MAAQKKQKIQVKLFVKRIRLKLGAFRERLRLRLASLRQRLRGRGRVRPRLWQTALLYLLVLLLTGGVYLWRTARLRTINPYAEKISFREQEDPEPAPAHGGAGEPEEAAEPAVPAFISGDSLSGKDVSGRTFLWPVEGRSIVIEYGESAVEVLACLEEAVKWFYSKGLGIAALPGEQVCSIGAGRVKEVGEAGKPYGKELIIEHENNLTVYYGALEQIEVKKGDQVSGGAPIATVKASPQDEGEGYLYLEIREDGRPVDPLQYLPQS